MKKHLIILLAIAYFLLPTQSCFAASFLNNLNASLAKISNSLSTSQNGTTVNQVSSGNTKKKITLSPEIGNKSMNLLLIKAVAQGDIDMVKKAVENGANVNIFANSESDTPLTLSLYQDNTEIFDYLVEQGADVNVQLLVNSWGRVGTPLIKAIMNASLVEKLIKLGADVNLGGIRGLRPIGEAILSSGYSGGSNHNSTEVVKILIANGAEMDYRIGWINNGTPLMYAIDKGNIELVQFLLSINASKSKKDDKGQTALDHAITTGNKDIIYLLMN